MGNQCGPSEPTEEVNNLVPTSSSDGVDATCMYSQWSDWSECGVTCGWGIKRRSRLVKFGSDQAPCESTTEKEICQGVGNCGNNSDVTTCLYSEWTSWSLCSRSCGNAMKFRSRVLKWPSEPENCHQPLKEMSTCMLPPCSCAYSQWSDWMKCPVTCGVGETMRKRILLSPDLNCTANLVERSMCMTSLSCSSEIPNTPGCNYTEWSDWSACAARCGVGQSVRKQILVSSTIGSCKNFRMETSKCMTSSSCDSCEYNDWSDWMACSTTCGEGTTMRKKILTGTNVQTICDDVVIEQWSCHNGPCLHQSSSLCVYLPWSRWMPCSVSCGKGETLRKRFLNRTASFENCQDVEMETNYCMVACDVISTSYCRYSDWSTWMPCSKSCTTFRKKLLHHSSTNAETCDRVVREKKLCLPSECKRGNSSSKRCRTTPWQPWSQCSVSCGNGGHMTRMRRLVQSPLTSCINPILTQQRRCRATTRCPVECATSLWTSWTACSAYCENSMSESRSPYQTRRRTIVSRFRNRQIRCKTKVQRRHCRCKNVINTRTRNFL